MLHYLCITDPYIIDMGIRDTYIIGIELDKQVLVNFTFVLRKPSWCEEVLLTATDYISKRKCFNLESDHTIPDFTGVTLVTEDTS